MHCVAPARAYVRLVCYDMVRLAVVWHGMAMCGILWYGKLEWATEFGEIPTPAFWTDGYGWHNSFETKCMECIEQERDIVNIKWTDSWERISLPPLSSRSRTNILTSSRQISWLRRTHPHFPLANILNWSRQLSYLHIQEWKKYEWTKASWYQLSMVILWW